MPKSSFAVLAAAAATVLAASAASQPSNVLLVVADDLGHDVLRAYRYGPGGGGPTRGELGQVPLPPTPTIDALARNGVVFDNFWVDTLCSPTRACVQTGRYSFRTGVGAPAPEGAGNPLRPVELTIPRVLDSARSGYQHAFFGKWHLGDGKSHPMAMGWSTFAGLLGRAASPSYFQWAYTVGYTTATSTAYATTQIVDDALAWIRAARSPWVCCVAFNAPHAPFHYPPPHLHRYKQRGPDRRFEAMVQALDTELGRLLIGIGPALANTNVLFLSDNGTPPRWSRVPWHGRSKSTYYEGGIRAPLIAAGPMVVGPPRVERRLVGAVDVFSTVLELCGVARPDTVPIDGASFVPALRSQGAPVARSHAYSEMFYAPTPFQDGFAAIRDRRYKLVLDLSGNGPWAAALFDLTSDPHETTPLLPRAMTTAQRAKSFELANAMASLTGH